MQLNLPKDIDAEKGILSLILSSPELFIEVADLLKPNDFYEMYHQAIWQAMQDAFKEGQEIDVVSIKSQLKKQERGSGPAVQVLIECYENPVMQANLLHFVREVKNKSALRQIIKMAQLQAYGASLEGADSSKVLEEFEKELLEIADSTKDGKGIDAESIISDVNKEIQEAKDRGWLGFNTGFPKLDERTGGFIPTQSWIIGAYTGIGKTFFILQLLLNVLREGAKVVLFSTEMDRKINMLRLIGNIAGLGTINMLRGRLLPNEEEEMRLAQKELITFKDKLTIYDNVYNLSEIRLKVKKLKLTKGLDVVAVDFIQNLKGPESIYERMSEAAIGLQQIAQELNVTMLIGSQVSQTSAGWQSKEAIEFKGAGEIAAIADVAIWMTKVESDEELREVIIRKIRHGARKKFKVKLEFPSGRIIDEDLVKEENVTEQL